jgi:hypothetical protein
MAGYRHNSFNEENDMKKYRIFHREWWKENPEWPNGLEPHIGKSHKIGEADTREEAHKMCKEWTDSRAKRFGKQTFERMDRLSDKAEFESNYD